MTGNGQSSSLRAGRCCLLFSPSFLFRVALTGEAGSFPIRRLVNDFAADEGDQDFGLADFRGFDFEQVAVEQDEVGDLARFERAFGLFAASREGRAQRVSADGVFEAQPLLRDEAAGWISFRGLASEGGL